MHFFNVNFQTEDCDVIIGSGIFNALVRCLTSTDRALVACTSSLADHPGGVLASMLHEVNDLAWQTLKFLTVLSLGQPEMDPVVLAGSVGRLHLKELHRTLVRIAALPRRIALASGVGALLDRTLDVLRLLGHFHKLPLGPDTELVRLVTLAKDAPPMIRALVLDLVATHLPHATEAVVTPHLVTGLVAELGNVILGPHLALLSAAAPDHAPSAASREEEVDCLPPPHTILARCIPCTHMETRVVKPQFSDSPPPPPIPFSSSSRPGPTTGSWAPPHACARRWWPWCEGPCPSTPYGPTCGPLSTPTSSNCPPYWPDYNTGTLTERKLNNSVCPPPPWPCSGVCRSRSKWVP